MAGLAYQFGVHNEVKVLPGDRDGIIDLAKYLSRPPVALGRLSYDGEFVRLQLRRPHWRTGQRQLIFKPVEGPEQVPPARPTRRPQVVARIRRLLHRDARPLARPIGIRGTRLDPRRSRPRGESRPRGSHVPLIPQRF